MPNAKIEGLHHSNLWVEYSTYEAAPEIESIYVSSDPDRTNIYDFIDAYVIRLAEVTIQDDYIETKAAIEFESLPKNRRYYVD